MSILSDFADWATGSSDKTLSADEYAANKERLDAQLARQGRSAVDAGQFDYVDPGKAAVSAGVNSLTFGLFGDAGNQPDGDNSNGFSAVLKDVLILAAIGGAIYLFVKLGGINQIKKLVS